MQSSAPRSNRRGVSADHSIARVIQNKTPAALAVGVLFWMTRTAHSGQHVVEDAHIRERRTTLRRRCGDGGSCRFGVDRAQCQSTGWARRGAGRLGREHVRVSRHARGVVSLHAAEIALTLAHGRVVVRRHARTDGGDPRVALAAVGRAFDVEAGLVARVVVPRERNELAGDGAVQAKAAGRRRERRRRGRRGGGGGADSRFRDRPRTVLSTRGGRRNQPDMVGPALWSGEGSSLGHDHTLAGSLGVEQFRVVHRPAGERAGEDGRKASPILIQGVSVLRALHRFPCL